MRLFYVATLLSLTITTQSAIAQDWREWHKSNPSYIPKVIKTKVEKPSAASQGEFKEQDQARLDSKTVSPINVEKPQDTRDPEAITETQDVIPSEAELEQTPDTPIAEAEAVSSTTNQPPEAVLNTDKIEEESESSTAKTDEVVNEPEVEQSDDSFIIMMNTPGPSLQTFTSKHS